MKNEFEKKYERKMIVFGTLLKGKMGAFKDILVVLGKEKEVKKIDEEYQKKKFKGPWGLEQLASLYKGFSQDYLCELALDYCQQNLIKGTREIITGLKNKDFLVGAISSNPQFVMDSLTNILPFDFLEGTQLEFKENVATGKIQRKVDRYIKAEILKNIRGRYKIKKEEIIVIGDSVTSFPMIREAKIFIDFDIQKENLQGIARIIVEHNTLKNIFRCN